MELLSFSNSIISPPPQQSPLANPTTNCLPSSLPIQRPKQSNFRSLCSNNSITHCEQTSIPIEKQFAAFPTVLDVNQIREILPHRFPFLLVDRVNPGVSAVAIKNVTINDNFFPGHFPERPIMPGVLMVEDAHQKIHARVNLKVTHQHAESALMIELFGYGIGQVSATALLSHHLATRNSSKPNAISLLTISLTLILIFNH